MSAPLDSAQRIDQNRAAQVFEVARRIGPPVLKTAAILFMAKEIFNFANSQTGDNKDQKKKNPPDNSIRPKGNGVYRQRNNAWRQQESQTGTNVGGRKIKRKWFRK